MKIKPSFEHVGKPYYPTDRSWAINLKTKAKVDILFIYKTDLIITSDPYFENIIVGDFIELMDEFPRNSTKEFEFINVKDSKENFYRVLWNERFFNQSWQSIGHRITELTFQIV